MAKSFTTISLVEIHAIVTLRSTTGCMISRIARSTAIGTQRFSEVFVSDDKTDPGWDCRSCDKLALTVTYAARFGITVSCCSVPVDVSCPDSLAAATAVLTPSEFFGADVTGFTLKSGFRSFTGATLCASI